MNTHWSEYWQQGFLTSFGADIVNYEGELKLIWENVVGDLSDNFKILDLCSGNGGLPILMSEQAEKLNLLGKIIGVDSASVNFPTHLASREKKVDIKLIPNVNCQEYKFDKKYFDLVTSQFGIEYTLIDKTLENITPALKKNGMISLVLHHTNSRILEENNAILTAANSAELKRVLKHFKSLVKAMGVINTKQDLIKLKYDNKCEQYRNKLNITIAKFIEKYGDSARDTGILSYIQTFFNEGMYWSVAQKKEYIDFIEKQIVTLIERLSELKIAAVDEEKFNDIQTKLGALGFKVNCAEELYENKKLLAWQLSATKS